MTEQDTDYDHHELAEWCSHCGALLTGNEARGRTCNDCLDARSGDPAEAPAPLRALAWGCWNCGEVFDSSTIRRLYRAAFEAWVQGSELDIAEHISCPECEAPGAMVRVSVSMAPGVSEWTAGHPWRVPA